MSLPSAPPLPLAAWADSKTVVGVTNQGELVLSGDAGGSWKTGAAKLTSAEAVCASRDKAAVVEILVATDKAWSSHATTVPLLAT